MIINPTRLTIDANASCQLRCPTCLTTSSKGCPPVVGNGYLTLSNLKNLLEANSQIIEVYFNNRGEMFLNPELLSIMEYLFQKNIPMTNHSGVNLNTVSERVLEGLVKYQFRHLLCSIDGATQETYRLYRVGGDFERVIENIRIINGCKKRFESEYPQLTWQFVVFGHNEHEIPLARQLARDLNMGFVAKMSWDSSISPIRNPEFVLAETGWPATTRVEFKRVTETSYLRNNCHDLWLTPRINWDGAVLGCCWNIMAALGGNAFRDGYVPSINNERINYARQMLMGQASPREDIPCSQCTMYLNMRDSDSYLTLHEIFPPKPFVNRVYDTISKYPRLCRTVRFLYRISGLKRLLGRE